MSTLLPGASEPAERSSPPQPGAGSGSGRPQSDEEPPSGTLRPQRDAILLGENLELLPRFADESFQLIYIDPPFNAGGTRTRTTLTTKSDPAGDRTGFQGRRYATQLLSVHAYEDSYEDYPAFIEPRLREARRLLCAEGTLYVHLDYREAHRCKLLLDEIFGGECFLNEIIWAYDYGGRSKRRWPAKHDTILVYVKDPARYFFDSEAVDREPYMAPGLVTPEKAARGKLPTDVWWHTIVSTNGAEKTGYPTQKPLGVLRRIVAASSRQGDWCLDFFAGSGTLGVAAASLGRRYVLIDSNPAAVAVMRARLPESAGAAPADSADVAPADAAPANAPAASADAAAANAAANSADAAPADAPADAAPADAPS